MAILSRTMKSPMGGLALAVLLVAASDETKAQGISSANTDFDLHVAPILAGRCLSCHQGSEPNGGLDLRGKDKALQGGESGVVIVAGRPEESLLWQHVDTGEMPPKDPLPDDEKAVLKRWIAAGAKWGRDPIDPFRYTSRTRAGYDWWSLQALGEPALPFVARREWCDNPIDLFILSRLDSEELKPSPEADRRQLIRRLHFDLVGLPPTPEEVEAFLYDDHPAAYEKLVDHLLASPHHGERWGRHWLDVARYGETDGFERNARRPNSWPYRDWVIDALNADMRYDLFCRKQLVGDIAEDARDRNIAATGFLVASVHNSVLGNDAMRAIARQDELEDMVGAVAQTFLGLTANCGRCHDHKFDPISQRDYYRLASALSGVNHGEVEVPYAPARERLEEFEKEEKRLKTKLAAIEHPIRRTILGSRLNRRVGDAKAPTPIAAWDLDKGYNDRIGSVFMHPVGDVVRGDDGAVLNGATYLRSDPLPQELREKTLEAWVRLDNLAQRGGGVISLATPDSSIFDAIVYGEQEPGRWMAGSNNFARYQSFAARDETEAASRFVQVVLTFTTDGTIRAYRDGVPYGQPYKSSGLQPFAAKGAVVLVGCRHEPPGGNRMLLGTISKVRLYDRALTPVEVAASEEAGGTILSDAEIAALIPSEIRDEYSKLKGRLAALRVELATLKPLAVPTIYAALPGKPAETRILARGDLSSPGELVSAGGVAALLPDQSEFGLSPNAADGERRQKLADWITHTDNPLFPRVMVNRLWHYHFGTGIVETPNDFGFNGGRPSHPEMLDWLATEFVQEGYSLKRLHRLIVTSRTFRQSSLPRADALAKDADNRLLWRKKPARMEGEVLRDSMLAVTGLLNNEYGGPAFSDYRVIDTMNGTTYYEPTDAVGAEFHRRSVYRFLPRGANLGLLDAFDCPDPAAAAPRRNVTTTPLQALSLWNSAFSLRMAEALAARIETDASSEISDQVALVFQWTLQRDPLESENSAAEGLVRGHGLKTLCRVLFNTSEFLTID